MTENQVCTAECRHCTPEEMRENAKRLLDALASRGSAGLIYASSLAHGKCREFSKAIETERYRRGWVDVYAFKTIGCPAYVYEALRCEQGLPEKTEAALRRYEGLNRVPVALPVPKSELGIFVERDRVWTTSRDVAAKFEKPHNDVLKSIRKLDCSPAFTAGNFSLSEYKDPTGRTLPQYLMTRDGFTFLAMGFTGPKAARFKEMYIAEFNRMEEELYRRRFCCAEGEEPERLKRTIEIERKRAATAIGNLLAARSSEQKMKRQLNRALDIVDKLTAQAQ